MATMWQLWQSTYGADKADTSTYDNEQVRLYGRLAAEIGDYRLGTRKEVNRNAIARLREQIRMQDNFSGQIHDLRESIAKDNRNYQDNATKMRTTLVNAREDLVKSRRPTSSYVYTAAVKANTLKGKSGMVKELVKAYRDETGRLGRLPDVQLYSILTEIDRAVPGVLQVDSDGNIRVPKDIAGVGDSEVMQLQLMADLANEAQRAYVSEQRAIDQ